MEPKLNGSVPAQRDRYQNWFWSQFFGKTEHHKKTEIGFNLFFFLFIDFYFLKHVTCDLIKIGLVLLPLHCKGNKINIVVRLTVVR